jgi:HSP20 family protein
MSLIKWNPESSLFPSFTTLMDDFFQDNGFKNWKGVSIPAVNISETKSAFKLSIAAPGFKKDDFKVEVVNGVMSISAETKTEKTEKDERYTRQEYSFSRFSRSFTLPDNVNGDGIVAEYLNGELKVTVPKAKVEEKPSVQIAVN